MRFKPATAVRPALRAAVVVPEGHHVELRSRPPDRSTTTRTTAVPSRSTGAAPVRDGPSGGRDGQPGIAEAERWRLPGTPDRPGMAGSDRQRPPGNPVRGGMAETRLR